MGCEKECFCNCHYAGLGRTSCGPCCHKPHKEGKVRIRPHEELFNHRNKLCKCFMPQGKEWADKFECMREECEIASCHKPHKEGGGWEKKLAILKKGREQSKHHKNYIATHIVEKLLEESYQEGREDEAIDHVTKDLNARDATIAEIITFVEGTKKNETFCGDDCVLFAYDTVLAHLKSLQIGGKEK